jgi:predicted GIY-YIG superfamily endonuclease
MTEYKIYGLKDPLDNKIKYVGVSKNVESRYKQHFYQDENDNSEKSNWIKELKKQDLRPELVILEVIETDDRNVALNKEKEYIKMYKNQVYNMNSNHSKDLYQKTSDWNMSDFTSILITKETKAMLKNYMDEYHITNSLDISYHKAIKALLAEHYRNIDNLFVEGNDNN